MNQDEEVRASNACMMVRAYPDSTLSVRPASTLLPVTKFSSRDGTYTYEWNSEDEVLYGDTNPDFTGALSTSFLYKGFSFGTTFSFRSGAEIFLSTLMEKVENISKSALEYNQDLRALTRPLEKPGDIAKYKRIDDTSTTYKSSRFVATEHTLSCASINFGYRTTTMPFLRTIGASSLDIRAYMNDIFRLSNIKQERGLSYPFQRSFSILARPASF